MQTNPTPATSYSNVSEVVMRWYDDEGTLLSAPIRRIRPRVER